MPRVEGVEVASGLYSPRLNIRIELAGHVLESPALLDSGADISIIPAEFLEGHPTLSYENLALAPPGEGAGGNFEVRRSQGRITWRQWVITDEVDVAKPEALDVPLLGREDFFKKFVIRFNWHRDPPTVDIDPISK